MAEPTPPGVRKAREHELDQGFRAVQEKARAARTPQTAERQATPPTKEIEQPKEKPSIVSRLQKWAGF